MRHTMTRIISLILLGSLTAGCNKPPSASTAAAKGEEEPARQTFVALQAALKAKDADQLWAMLDTESQADAERAAKAVQEAYTKATPDAKAALTWEARRSCSRSTFTIASRRIPRRKRKRMSRARSTSSGPKSSRPPPTSPSDRHSRRCSVDSPLHLDSSSRLITPSARQSPGTSPP